MTARFTELFKMKTTRNNFNVTSTPHRNGVKIGNFVFTLTNVGFYVLPVREIILCSSPYKLSGCTLQSVTETVDLGVSLTSNLSSNTQTQKVVNKANNIVGFLKKNVGPGKRKSFLVSTRPCWYSFWNMLSLSGHPSWRRTLTLLNEFNVGPRNTLSRCYLGTLRTKKDWQCLGCPVFNQGGPIYLC